MKDTATLTEYGMPIEAQTMVKPPDTTELELEAGHPGPGRRRIHRAAEGIIRIMPEAPLGTPGPPIIAYTPEETRIWREVSPMTGRTAPQVREFHLSQGETRSGDHARRDSAASASERRGQRETNMHLVPAEGACRTEPSTNTSPNAVFR